MQTRRLAAPLFALGLGASAHAQDTISTDRPGIMISPVVVPEGRLQVEAGLLNLTLTRGNGSDTELWNTPVLLRYGLAPKVELRLFGTPWNRLHDDVGGADAEGPGDVEIGAKIALGDGGSGPKTAVIFGARLPVGEDEFTSHRPGYDVNFAATWDLGDDAFLCGLAGVTRTPVGDENATTGTLGLLVGRSFTSRLGGYVETGWFPDIDDAVDTAVVGTGVTFLVDADLQLDAFGDFGLNSDTPDAAIGFGFSWRL